MTNVKDKANIFNDFFSKQCQPIPSIQSFETFNRLSTADIDSKKILKINAGFEFWQSSWTWWYIYQNAKLCEPSVIKPLSLLFNNCLKDGVFPNDWKKANVIPVYKKEIRD